MSFEASSMCLSVLRVMSFREMDENVEHCLLCSSVAIIKSNPVVGRSSSLSCRCSALNVYNAHVRSSCRHATSVAFQSERYFGAAV